MSNKILAMILFLGRLSRVGKLVNVDVGRRSRPGILGAKLLGLLACKPNPNMGAEEDGSRMVWSWGAGEGKEWGGGGGDSTLCTLYLCTTAALLRGNTMGT